MASPPSLHVRAVLDAERAAGFQGLDGSTVKATLPVRQAVVDAAIGSIRDWPSGLAGVTVEIGDANRLFVTVRARVFGFSTPIRLQLRLAPSMQDGIVHLFIDDGSLMASPVALLGPLLGSLPDGVTLQGRQITIDVPRVAVQQGVDDLACMLSGATFESSRGVVWVTLHAAAPVPAPIPSRETAHSPSRRPGAVDVATLRTWLEGSQVDVDLRLDERLANDLVTALHADAQVRTGDDLRDTVTHALRPPSVRFESGAVRLQASVALDPDDVSNR
jgi:hypothetical protein